jgi:hypothetical protein
LTVHLKGQEDISSRHANAPVLKAIAIIRAMIEDKGDDPDILLEQLRTMPEDRDGTSDEWLQQLLQQKTDE